MISVVIRNKNEAVSLEKLLKLLHQFYDEDIDQVIVVDNESTDNSIKIANSYNAQVTTIKDFTYGKAINLGMKQARNPYVLLLSSHAYPLGDRFFKDSISLLEHNQSIAALRYINSFADYERFIHNNGVVKEPVKFGTMNACAMIRKSAWEQFPFDEKLMFSEDKKWSEEITDNLLSVQQIRHTFFYHVQRNRGNNLTRWFNETTAAHILNRKDPPSALKAILIFIKANTVDAIEHYLINFVTSFKRLRLSLTMKRMIKQYHKDE
ncbi:hypothetical protein BST91_07965 [Nonlabens tegetincola]|uniref:glycosyltransferase family 2 protein n=1 Tax=Nonlabens tegetincola TaxID=323273 RepID=UPI000A202B23|nr:glycosyltransferase [Nonlabens tegetincola]ARN71580.1 hypothetical protein BST91_07965 [Nonlabens tegetincola]